MSSARRGLTTAIHEAGFVMTEHDPDFVVVGETHSYSFEAITKAIRLIDAGSRFIVTNPDATGPSPEGVLPATGAIAALITKATNREPYVVGKPNPMMFRSALNRIGAHSMSTAMIGDRMDTDIIAGMEAGMHTVLVLSGISTAEDVRRFPFRPNEIVDGVHNLLDVPLESRGDLGPDPTGSA
jgi:NagD protein